MSVQTSRPITEGEFNQLLGEVLKEASTLYRTEIQPQQAELNAKRAELGAKRAELEEKAVRIQLEIAEAREMKAKGAEMKAKGAEMKAKGAEMKARGLEGLKEVAQERQVIAQEKTDLLAESLYAIFKKTPLPGTEKPIICNLFIPKNKLSLEKTAAGKSYLQMNSAKPVIKYSEANPGIKALDFRHFADKIAIKCFHQFARYLAKPKLVQSQRLLSKILFLPRQNHD